MSNRETALLSRYTTAILAAKNDAALLVIARKLNRLSVSDECDRAVRAKIDDQRAWNTARSRYLRTLAPDEPLPTRSALESYRAA